MNMGAVVEAGVLKLEIIVTNATARFRSSASAKVTKASVSMLHVVPSGE
jgi:hypothetical protein